MARRKSDNGTNVLFGLIKIATWVFIAVVTGLVNLTRYLYNLAFTKNRDSGNEGYRVSIELDDKGHPILNLKDSSGRQITNPTSLRLVKKSEEYKRAVEKLIEDHKKKIAEDKLRQKNEKEREKEKERLRKLEEKKASKTKISEVKQNNNISSLK